jgi:putative membrane protein
MRRFSFTKRAHAHRASGVLNRTERVAAETWSVNPRRAGGSASSLLAAQLVRVVWSRGIGVSAIALVALPRAAWAHVGRAPEPHDLWTAWTFAPTVIVGLVVASWLYARGVRALWHAAGTGRGIPAWRVACFAGGIATLAIALLSPIDSVATALFAVHMIQHMLLVVVAPPLLVLGDPALASIWALRIGARRGVAGWWRAQRVLPAFWDVLRRPLVAFSLQVAALWLWHLPALYDAALRNEGVHVAEHVSFLATALLFWYPIADARPRQRFGVGVATLYLFAAGLQCTMLGALIAMSRRPWYFGHFGTTGAWGLTPLEDQQLAGLVMWIPAGLVYLAALIPTVLPVLRGDRATQWVTSPTAAGVSARGTP